MNKEFSLETLIENYMKLSYHNKQKANKYVQTLGKRQNGEKKVDNYAYLNKFTTEVKEFVIKIDEEEDLNLYHSVTSYIMNREEKNQDEIYKEYFLQYKSKREYLIGNENIIKELINGIYKEFKRRGSI